MTRSSVLIAVCVLVLAGTWLASRSLAGDPPPPPAPATQAPVPPPTERMRDLTPVMQTGTEARERQKQAFIAARGGTIEPVVVAPQQQASPEAPAEEAPSPWEGESVELTYADRLLFEPDAGLERLRSARDVYARCLEAMPANQRCKDNLVRAELLIHPPKANAGRPAPTEVKAPLEPAEELLRKR